MKNITPLRWLEQVWRAKRTYQHAVLNEYYVTVTRKLKPGMRTDDAWDDIQDLLAWEPRSTDRELLLRAKRWSVAIVSAAGIH